MLACNHLVDAVYSNYCYVSRTQGYFFLCFLFLIFCTDHLGQNSNIRLYERMFKFQAVKYAVLYQHAVINSELWSPVGFWT